MDVATEDSAGAVHAIANSPLILDVFARKVITSNKIIIISDNNNLH